MKPFAIAALVPFFLTGTLAARAQDKGSDPAAVCRQAGDEDRLQPIPNSLASAARRLFGLGNAPDPAIRRLTVYRCMDGAVMLCNSGANLPCGRADTGRDLPGATKWCQEHPGTPVIPMVASGHATIYRWRCIGTKAQADGPMERIDARGFVARVWKRLG